MMSRATRGANGTKHGRMPQGGNVNITVDNETPQPPKHLGVPGKIRWMQFSGILLRRGTWSNDWIPALEHLCREYDNLAIIDTALKDENEFLLVPSSQGRTLKCNPLLDYRLKLEAFIQSQLNAFGLTPMAAKGIYTPQDGGSKDNGIESREQSNDNDLFSDEE